MGDLSASDSSWNKMVIAKSNNKWISKVKYSLDSEAPENLVMNVHFKSEVQIKQESHDSDQETFSEIDGQSNDTAPDTDHLIERFDYVKKSFPISDPLDLNTSKNLTKRKQHRNSTPQSKNETPEERAERLAKMSAYAARRLANETPEQRSLRLRRMSEYAAKRLSRESPEERARRLSRMSAYAAQRLANETPEQRHARLSRMSAYAARRQAMRKNESVITDNLKNTIMAFTPEQSENKTKIENKVEVCSSLNNINNTNLTK